jgi:hypothetical protein
MKKALKVGCVIFVMVGVIFITAMFVGVDVRIDEDGRSKISFGDHPGFKLTRQLNISILMKEYQDNYNKKPNK